MPAATAFQMGLVSAAGDALRLRAMSAFEEVSRPFEFQVIAISEEPVSFGAFARLFRESLKAPNALYFDGSGLLLCVKRLARGRFDWPEEIEGVAKVAISATEFAALIDGLELTRTRAKLAA